LIEKEYQRRGAELDDKIAKNQRELKEVRQAIRRKTKEIGEQIKALRKELKDRMDQLLPLKAMIQKKQQEVSEMAFSEHKEVVHLKAENKRLKGQLTHLTHVREFLQGSE